MTQTYASRIVSSVLFALGALVVLWMGAGFVGSSLLALLVCALIAAAYTTGFVELLRYQRETQMLREALEQAEQPVAELSEWLAALPQSLRYAVRQRINGEAMGLPAPVLTPYLVGLLVMLGLLGTFIGMVETLQGAVGALEANNELEAVRDGLAAPIQGLGLAFATSVAGITASAMLGLISTLSRRERLQVSRMLDREMGGLFQSHSLNHQRRETYDALRLQADALPAAAEQLSQLASHFDERMTALAEQLTQHQQQLQSSVVGQLEQLSHSVERSLQEGFKDSGRAAAESAAPVLQSFIKELADQAQSTQTGLRAEVEQQLSGIRKDLLDGNQQLSQHWRQALSHQDEVSSKLLGQMQEQFAKANEGVAQTSEALVQGFEATQSKWMESVQSTEQQRLTDWQQQSDASVQRLKEASELIAKNAEAWSQSSQQKLDDLLQKSQALLDGQMQRESAWQAQAGERLEALVKSAAEQLSGLRDEEQQRGEAAIQRLEQLQESSAKQLSMLGESLEAPLSRLMETASEAPKAAAELIGQLRQEISKNIERDNALLSEREQTFKQMETLSASLEENARLQREAVQSMLAGSSEQLAGVADAFEKRIAEESAGLTEQIAHFSATATELSVLGEVFGEAVKQFGSANEQLMSQLSNIETALVGASERSDEQMGYYLAQAREIIDHNLTTQQEILERLQESVAVAES